MPVQSIVRAFGGVRTGGPPSIASLVWSVSVMPPLPSPFYPAPVQFMPQSLIARCSLLDPDPVHAGRRFVTGVKRDEEIAVRQKHRAGMPESPGQHVLPEIFELAWSR
jgi:hypothetical protein